MRKVPFVLRCPACKREFVRTISIESDISESCFIGMTFMEHCVICGNVDDFPIVSVADEELD